MSDIMALDIEAIIWSQNETVRGRGHPYNMYGMDEPLKGQDEIDATLQGFLGFKIKNMTHLTTGGYVLNVAGENGEELLSHWCNIVKMIKSDSELLIEDNTGDWYIYEGDLIHSINKMINMDDLCFLNDSDYEGCIA